MARSSNKWIKQLIDNLPARFDSTRENWERLSLLADGPRGQQRALSALSQEATRAVIEEALELAGFKQPEDPVAKKFHNVLLDYYVDNTNRLPNLYEWSKKYHKSPNFAPLPEQRESLDSILQTKKGTLRNPIHSLYRLLRGNANLNESKDFISVFPSIHDSQVSTALNKLYKHGYIKYDPESGVTLIPRDTIRRIDPYYTNYQDTFNALHKAIDDDYRAAVLGEDPNTESAQGKKYRELAKAFAQDKMRRNMPRIAEDLPMEERERLFAEQQERLQNIDEYDIDDSLIQMRNLAYLRDFPGQWYWQGNTNNPMMRLASMFSEKGLRSLLNNPKRLLKIAQINELLDDKWDDITASRDTTAWHPTQGDGVPRETFYNIPYQDAIQLERVEIPGGPWKNGDLQSLNNYDTFRRQLEDRKRTIERNKVQARDRIVQYIEAHPELQQLAEQNAREQQRLRDMRGIGYTPNREDEEEERIIRSLGNKLIGSNYSAIAKTLLDHPRLAELAERPYQYGKELQDSVNGAETPWRLANNRRELYDRSLHHNICIGMPVMAYHDKALAKKSLLFFSGEHTDAESEAGEIALYIDPKTHKIAKADVIQVHGLHNAPGKKESTSDLQTIADTLVGKRVDDTDDVVEQKDIEYKEEQQAPEEDEFDENDEGYVEGGFVEPTANPAYRRLLELLLEDGMTKPSKHVVSLASRRI
jgi:hypothetical protein